MRIALVGCGFVADMYMTSLALHPELEVAGVFDRDAQRLSRFCAFHRLRAYGSLAELLADPSIVAVANLTNPGSHFEVSQAALLAGKHVYSEKPLAMQLEQARALVELAEQRGLQLSSAPCGLLSETAQTMARALRENKVGRVRAVYAEMDDGLVHRMPYRLWVSESGAPWPYRDEFEVGCTLEHAGYSLTWLVGFFGPATAVTCFASVQIPDKLPEAELDPERPMGPDLSVACVEFASGVVARLTCSIIAPHDHRLQIFGDEGVLWTDDTWRYRSPVFLRRFLTLRRRMMLNPLPQVLPLWGTHLKLPKATGSAQMDFARGLGDMAEALVEKRAPRISARFALHVNEIALAIHHATRGQGRYEMTTTFDPAPAMPWAEGGAAPRPAKARPRPAPPATPASVAVTGRPTRWAIVGTGFVARGFARSLALAANARLTAVVSRNGETARTFAGAFAPDARAYGDLDAALADPEVDIVYIATPHHLHAPQAIAALEAGKPVLVEKPFATNAADARRIVETARRRNLFCMEAMWMRCLPLVRRAQQLIAEGAIGTVQTLAADFASPNEVFNPQRDTDGALLDRGVYCLSLAYLLLGAPALILSTAALAPGGADQQCSVMLRYASGASAMLWASMSSDGSNQAAIHGTRGTLRLHAPFFRPHRLTVTPLSAPFTGAQGDPQAPGLATRVKENPLVQRVLNPAKELLHRPQLDVHEPIAGPGYQFEADEVARCLAEGLTESPLVPLDESLRIMEAMDQIRVQWRRGPA